VAEHTASPEVALEVHPQQQVEEIHSSGSPGPTTDTEFKVPVKAGPVDGAATGQGPLLAIATATTDSQGTLLLLGVCWGHKVLMLGVLCLGHKVL